MKWKQHHRNKTTFFPTSLYAVNFIYKYLRSLFSLQTLLSLFRLERFVDVDAADEEHERRQNGDGDLGPDSPKLTAVLTAV
jgi:hypothetical protein